MNRPLQELYDHCMKETQTHARLRDIAKAGGNEPERAKEAFSVIAYSDVLRRLASLHGDQLDSVGFVDQASVISEQVSEEGPPDATVVVCQPTPEPVAPDLEAKRLEWGPGPSVDDLTSFMAPSRVVHDDESLLYYRVMGHLETPWSITQSDSELVGHLSDGERVFDSESDAKASCQKLDDEAAAEQESEPSEQVSEEETPEPVAADLEAKPDGHFDPDHPFEKGTVILGVSERQNNWWRFEEYDAASDDIAFRYNGEDSIICPVSRWNEFVAKENVALRVILPSEITCLNCKGQHVDASADGPCPTSCWEKKPRGRPGFADYPAWEPADSLWDAEEQESGSSEQVSEAEPVAPVVAEECPRLRWEESDDFRNLYRGTARSVNWKAYRAVSAAVGSDDRGPVYRVSNSTGGWGISDTQNELKHHLSEEEIFRKYPSPDAAKAFCQELEQKAFEAKQRPS